MAITPAGVREQTGRGHIVLVQEGRRDCARFSDEVYMRCGARLLDEAGDVFQDAEMIVKVKEPQRREVEQYPMSEIAGRLAAHAAAWTLQRPAGGPGCLPGGIAGVAPATILIIGAGVIGTNAAEVALGIGAHVFIIDRGLKRLRELETRWQSRCTTIHASHDPCQRAGDRRARRGCRRGHRRGPHPSRESAVGARPPAARADEAQVDPGRRVHRSGRLLRDLEGDDARRTDLELDRILHYCVANMPAAVSVTPTRALTNATQPWILKLADQGLQAALRAEAPLRAGINVFDGHVTCDPVARAAGLRPADVEQLAA